MTPTRCEHAETTTLLWLYGEADDSHAAHVASCQECSEIARMHADVVPIAAPVLRQADSASAQTLAPEPAARRGPSPLWGLAGLAVAAALLIGLGLTWIGVAEEPSPAPVALTAAAPEPSQVARLLLDDATSSEADDDLFDDLLDDLDWLEQSLASL